jgi:cysteine synthase B
MNVIEAPPALDAGARLLIGRTPLVRLSALEPRPGVEIHAKLESRNPGGSVKDRAALAIILDGLRTGALGSGRVLLDATSGNTGIAYAMIGAARGVRVHLCVPANITVERRRLLHAYGATVVPTDPMEGTDGAIREARRLAEADPRRYFYADQYGNAANWRAHYETTAVELIEQTAGRLTHFVAGLGTSGTFVGTGRRLREWRESVELIAVQPDSPLHGLEGLKHMATAIVPAIYDAGLADRHEVAATDEAYDLVRRLARREGLLVGPSSGAALAVALRVARHLDRGVVVVVFPDSGDRYLSASVWRDEPASSAPPVAPREVAPSLHVPADVASEIKAHGARAYPDECCGALIGAGDRVVEAVPLSNSQSRNRERRFLIDAAAYRQAEARAAEVGGALIGFYHSHPDHPAMPSAFDLEHAWPNLSYPIVSVQAGRPEELRSWRLSPDRSGFVEETLVAGLPAGGKDL